MNGIKERFSTLGVMVGSLMVGALVMAGAASAEPADPVADGFADIEAKATTYAGLLVALVVVVVGLLYGIAWIRKARSAK